MRVIHFRYLTQTKKKTKNVEQVNIKIKYRTKINKLSCVFSRSKTSYCRLSVLNQFN